MNLPIFYDVDISKPLLPTPLQPMLVTADALANRIGVRLYEGNEPYSPGGSCAGFAVRRDGMTVPITGTISGNEMYIDLPAAAYALEGPINIGIKNVSGSQETTVFLGLGTVVRGETGSVIDPGTIIPSVSALIEEIESAIASIPADYSALLASIAPAFSASNNYVIGNYVWHDGNLYRFSADHPAGSWIGTDASRYTATDEYALLRANLNTATANLTADIATRAPQTMIASTFSPSANYTAGSYVIYSGNLYRFNADHPAGAWTGTDAARYTATDEYALLRANLNTATANLTAEVAELKSAIAQVTENSRNILPTQSKTATVNGVTAVYEDGILELSGTATGTGGRLTPVTDSFVLPAGTYTFSRAPQSMPLFLESGSSIVAQINNDSTSKTFTLANETTCYIGVNVDSGTTYNRLLTVQLETGSNETEWEKPSSLSAIDTVARADCEEAIANIQNLDNRTMISIDLSDETAESGKLINSNNGTELTNQGSVYAATGFIDISAFAGLSCSIRSLFGGWFGVAFYNAAKTYVSGIGSTQSGTTADSVATISVTIPGNASFIRFSLRSSTSLTVSDYPIICTSPLFAIINGTVKANNITEMQNYFSTLSLFEKIGVCGDSFASGEIHVGNTTQMYYNLSWPQILARKCGVTVYNYAVSGYSTRTFLTSESRGLPKLLSDDPQNLYIMAFGLNDINISNYIGSIADITADYHNNPDTFYGNYARIIEQVKAHAPNAKIILSTMARKFSQSAYTAFDDAIVEIAEHYNIPCIRVMDDPFFNSNYFQAGLVGYHPTGILYAGMAEAYQRLFSKSAIDYAAYYADYVGS